jgi:hypothetical protein
MLRLVAPVRTDISKEHVASIIRRYVLTTATRCNIPEDGIIHSHRRENLKSYMNLPPYPTNMRSQLREVKLE